MRLYLDDIRPCPPGMVLAKTVADAIIVVLQTRLRGDVFEAASLDHDLGACEECRRTSIAEHALWLNDGAPPLPDARYPIISRWQGVMPFCRHFGTGLDFVDWMVKSGIWPVTKPTVHSMNPSGARQMRLTIDRYFGLGRDGGTADVPED